MSFYNKEDSPLSSQEGLSINELVDKSIASACAPLYLAPLLIPNSGRELSYYGKPVTLTTQETKGLRKLSRLFNRLAEQGYIPSILSPNLAIEWGNPDGLRLAFFPIQNSYVHAKEFTLRKSELNAPSQSCERVFITGTCMYGKNGVVGRTDKGKTLSLVDPYITPTASYEEYGCITSLEFEDDFHIYEIMGALSRGRIMNDINADVIYFNIPLASYVLYAKEAITRNILDPKLMDVWVAQLKKRAGQLISYEQSICNGKVIPIDPLYPYLDLISAPDTTLKKLVEFLANSDDWWKTYFAAKPAEKFGDIGTASYTRAYYDALGARNSSRTVIAVEDQTEMRILLEIKKLIESGLLPKPNEASSIIGLYPFTPVIFPDSNGQANATFLSDNIGKEGEFSSLLNLCSRSVGIGLTKRAAKAYAAIRTSEQNNYQLNIV